MAKRVPGRTRFLIAVITIGCFGILPLVLEALGMAWDTSFILSGIVAGALLLVAAVILSLKRRKERRENDPMRGVTSSLYRR